jgi:hypothetical protein
MLPPESPDAAAHAWRWANAPSPYESDGNVDMGPDAIVLHDPELVPAPPTGSPSAFYLEGGNAVLRSDWSPDGVVAVAVGEYDTASEFGRDRGGIGVRPESHEHAEPGSFLLHAFGERLALDPGYLSFGERDRVNRPEHHNLILVDGRGPVDYLAASLGWVDGAARPSADGHASLSQPLDTGFMDAVRITTSYGFGTDRPFSEAPLLRRRFLFPDHAYLLIGDALESRDAAPHTFTWLVHGNGGGTDPDGSPGGAFAPATAGGRWTRGGARMDATLALDAAIATFTSSLEEHEVPHHKLAGTHTTLRASASGESLRGVLLVYPSRSADPGPDVAPLDLSGAAALLAKDAAGDRRLLAWHRAGSGPPLAVPDSRSMLGDSESDGSLALFDTTWDGSLRLAYAEDATRIRHAGHSWLDVRDPGLLSVAPGEGRVDYVLDNGQREIALPGLPFRPRAADGTCELGFQAGVTPVVALGRERRIALREDAGNSRPAADPGPDRRVAVGTVLELDGRESCDADGDALTPRWQLVSAPAGHDWVLEGANSWLPRLAADRAGPYRVRLVVRDARGAESLPLEVRILAGPSCADGVDDDLDGQIDADDAGCIASGGLGEGGLGEGGLGPCGIGFELTPLLALFAARRRRASAHGARRRA